MRIIIDAGHGGISPFNNEYVTAGKRMVKDGITFYEGVNNRDNAERIAIALIEAGHDVFYNDKWKDVPLTERCYDANKLNPDLLISIHSDANGNGKEWNSASGIGTYIYTNCSQKTKAFAHSIHNALVCNFDGIAKDRGIRKAGFYILKHTNCPAVLLELGFHTNKEEVQKMLTEDWKERVVASIVEAVEEYSKKS